MVTPRRAAATRSIAAERRHTGIPPDDGWLDTSENDHSNETVALSPRPREVGWETLFGIAPFGAPWHGRSYLLRRVGYWPRENSQLSKTQHDLQTTYAPNKGWSHFVLYTEPERGIVTSGLHAAATFEQPTRYVKEWLSRLRECEPNPLHTLLVENSKIPSLFHPCVYEDRESPSAIAEDGCVCHQTFMDLEFGLPVVAHHYRTVSGNIENWTYRTFAPAGLRAGESFASMIIDGGAYIWIRTSSGLLSIIPEGRASGYSVGYNGGGPTALASYIRQLIETDGRDTRPLDRAYDEQPDRNLLAWTSSKAATATQELTLADLRRIQGG